MTVSQANAEDIAMKAIAFVFADEDRLTRFVSTTGVAPADLKALLHEPDFQSSVLDYLLQDESLLMTFSANAQVPPEDIAPARIMLSGRPQFEL